MPPSTRNVATSIVCVGADGCATRLWPDSARVPGRAVLVLVSAERVPVLTPVVVRSERSAAAGGSRNVPVT